MPHRRNGTSSKKHQEQEIAALAAITNAFLQEVKEAAIQEQPKIMQIIIYESSV